MGYNVLNLEMGPFKSPIPLHVYNMNSTKEWGKSFQHCRETCDAHINNDCVS